MAKKQIPESIPWTATGVTLGGGGQGQILEVEPKDGSNFPSGKYAMKVLGPKKSDQALHRFMQEIETIKQIKDPRIIEIVAYYGIFDDSFYNYVMPDYNKRGYKDVKKLAFEPDYHFKGNPHKCLQLIAECAEALSIVHDKGISHRDISPKNILYNTETEKPLIIDFGICHRIDNENITLTDEAVGTRYYMAPECERGQVCEPHLLFLADIYSLGKLLWALVTGRDSFDREKPAFTTHNMEILFPENYKCWHLTRIFKKTIRSDPKNRYTSAAILAEDCRQVMYLMDQYPPLESASRYCPACGGLLDVMPETDGLTSLTISREPKHMEENGYFIYECDTCGFICLWNKNKLIKRQKELKQIE